MTAERVRDRLGVRRLEVIESRARADASATRASWLREDPLVYLTIVRYRLVDPKIFEPLSVQEFMTIGKSVI